MDGGRLSDSTTAEAERIEILPRRPRRCGVLCVGFASLFLAIRGPRRPRCPTPDRPQARTYAPNYSALLAVLQNR